MNYIRSVTKTLKGSLKPKTFFGRITDTGRRRKGGTLTLDGSWSVLDKTENENSVDKLPSF